MLARLTRPWETATRSAAEVWAQPWLPGGLLLGFAIAYALTLLVEARMSGHFSGFWFVKQEELRDGLKKARLETRAAQTAVPSPASEQSDEELVTARVASLF